MIEPKIIEAFHTMWDSFPAPVRLIYKDRTVLAVNAVARERGFKPGEPCFLAGTPEQHKGCKAPEALAANRAVQALNPEKDTIRFWLPVKDCPDACVHFPLKLGGTLSEHTSST